MSGERMGWHAIHGDTILAALREVEAGRTADEVMLALCVDADGSGEDAPPGSAGEPAEAGPSRQAPDFLLIRVAEILVAADKPGDRPVLTRFPADRLHYARALWFAGLLAAGAGTDDGGGQ